MDIKNLKSGMKIVIASGLIHSKTRERFKLDHDDNPDRSYMIKMEGNIHVIDSTHAVLQKVLVKCPDAGRTFVFDPSDIKPIDEDEYYGPPPEPVTFDTKALDI